MFFDFQNAPEKKKLLAKYADRPPTAFGQLDGHLVGRDCQDDIMRPDDDGDCLMNSTTFELMHGADVRIFIKRGTSKADAIRLITKLLRWFESDAEGEDLKICELSKLLADIPGLDDLGGIPFDIPFG